MKKLDQIGFMASLLCAVHCSILPFLIVAFPILGLSFFVSEIFEWMFLTVSLLLGLTSLCFGYKKHKSFKAFPYLATGLTFIVIGRIMHHHAVIQKHFELDFYNILLIFGGILVAISHKINYILCHTCKKCKH